MSFCGHSEVVLPLTLKISYTKDLSDLLQNPYTSLGNPFSKPLILACLSVTKPHKM